MVSTKHPAQYIPNLINGQWRSALGKDVIERRNPADHDEVVSLARKATVEDAKEALMAACAALPGWMNTPPPLRGTILDKASRILRLRSDEIALALTREEGKTLAEAKAEVLRACDSFRYYSGEGWRLAGQVLPSSTEGELLYTRREPPGVDSIITPWNFPIAIPAWKIAPALICGNTVVFKPAETTPLVGLMLVEALQEAGIPVGVINFLTGEGGLIGEEMVCNSQVNAISFTGSCRVGQHIYQRAIKNLTRVQLEMGEKNALVVLKDGDIDLALSLAVQGGFGQTGQACTATSRIIVEDEIADEFASKLTRLAGRLVVGNGVLPETQMGPVVSRKQFETVQEYLGIGQEEEASLLSDGLTDDRKGFFVHPAIFDHVQPDMQIAQEEIFGPVISMIRVRNLDDAIEKTNRIRFGLTAGIVTNNLQKAFAFARYADVGVVKINESTTGLAIDRAAGDGLRVLCSLRISFSALH